MGGQPREPLTVTASVEAGFEATLAVLRATHKVEAADEAVVVACRALAQAIDSDAGDSGLWREYRAYLGRLLAGAGSDDGLSGLLARLSAPVVDSPES